MSKMYNLTDEQLDFISFMKAGVALRPDLNDRFKTCLNKNSKNSDSDGTGTEIILNHSPKKMIEFLSLFSRDDRFKWYTHKWDMSESFDIVEMKERQNEYKGTLSNMAYPKESGPAINNKTYNQVWNFINFENEGVYPWKNTKYENIRYGWHLIPELSKDHPDIAVEDLVLEDGHQFRDYIRMFKAVIEFRTDLKDEDRFSELVFNRVTSGLPKDFEVNFSSDFDEIGYDLNVYCDVVGILCALDILCGWMVRHKSISSSVNIDLISENGYYILEVSHTGSYFNNIDKLRNPSGDFDNLRKRLFSVCDFSMAGDFRKDGQKRGSLTVVALNENTRLKKDYSMTSCEITASDKEIGGIKYQLKIYKRQ